MNITDKDILDKATEIVQKMMQTSVVNTEDGLKVIEKYFVGIKEIITKSSGDAISTPIPAVPIKKSITPDFLICLEDGKKFKSLKRHLRTSYNLSPDEYREKWSLPHDYPMVAPKYSEERSKLAKKMGLGQRDQSGELITKKPKSKGSGRINSSAHRRNGAQNGASPAPS